MMNEFHVLNDEDKSLFNSFIVKAHEARDKGEDDVTLHYYERALKITRTEKLVHKTEKLRQKLSTHIDYGNGFIRNHRDECVLDRKLALPCRTYDALYPYQVEGLKWLWGIHKRACGGILADDMGLGKTIQIVAYVQALFYSEKVQTVIIVSPLSVGENWEKEFKLWAPELRIKKFKGTPAVREEALNKVIRKGGILLVTYQMVVYNQDKLSHRWGELILDEGHLIKNPSRRMSQALAGISSRNRIILTGTPIQNNLMEMWALFDFCCDGDVLGTAKDFKTKFASKIVRASQRDATTAESERGLELTEELRSLLAPFWLRREKKDVLCFETNTSNSVHDDAVQEHKPVISGISSTPLKAPQLGHKDDLVVWVKLSSYQLRLYRNFVESAVVRALLNTTKSPLAALTVLKRICDHPFLLNDNMKYCQSLDLAGDDNSDNLCDVFEKLTTNNAAMTLKADNILSNNSISPVESCGKLQFVSQLFPQLHAENHRVLLFSSSKKLLDIVDNVFSEKFSIIRIDGSITKMEDRQKLISRFNSDRSIFCCLLTTQVGGVGITLTGADRVVIFDPSWNPAVDSQAVDRAYRIGQTRDVIVYRLVTCGSIEEKIYRKQVFKDSLMRSTTQGVNPTRFFSRQELCHLFDLDDPEISETQRQLTSIHDGTQFSSDDMLGRHISWLESMDRVFGISDHNLIYKSGSVPPPTLDVKPKITGNSTKARNAIITRTPRSKRPAPDHVRWDGVVNRLRDDNDHGDLSKAGDEDILTSNDVSASTTEYRNDLKDDSHDDQPSVSVYRRHVITISDDEDNDVNQVESKSDSDATCEQYEESERSRNSGTDSDATFENDNSDQLEEPEGSSNISRNNAEYDSDTENYNAAMLKMSEATRRLSPSRLYRVAMNDISAKYEINDQLEEALKLSMDVIDINDKDPVVQNVTRLLGAALYSS